MKESVTDGYLKNVPFRASLLWEFCWCGREDSNLHGIATASPSSWCVCQFRHCRNTGILSRFAGIC